MQGLQYFTLLLFCKRNEIPLGAHFIYLNSGSLSSLKMVKKIAETCRPVNNKIFSFFMIFVVFIDGQLKYCVDTTQ